MCRGLNEYQDQAMITAGTHEQPVLYGALAVAGEAGEVVDAIKKKLFHRDERITNPMLAKELGDVLWGIAYLARQLGYTLEQIASMNIEKLRKRYPAGFEDGGGIR